MEGRLFVSKILEAGVLGLQLQVEELVKSLPISKLEEDPRFEKLVQTSSVQSENQIIPWIFEIILRLLPSKS